MVAALHKLHWQGCLQCMVSVSKSTRQWVDELVLFRRRVAISLLVVKPSGPNDDSADGTEEQGPRLHRGIPSKLKQLSDPRRSSDADHIIAKSEDGRRLRCRSCHSTSYYTCIACKVGMHISSFMINQLHWLPLTARIQFKVLVLVLKSKLGIAPKYLRDRIRSPLSSVSHRPLRSLVRHALFVPRVRTTMAQTRSFATIGPSLWNALPLPLYVLPLFLGLFLQPSPSSKPSSSLGVLALGALLNGHCCGRRYIN